MKRRIQIDDQVIVIAGRDKGRTGYVQRFVGTDRVIVTGVNQVQRHKRAVREGDQSGIISQEAALHLSNIAMYNPETSKRDKVKFVEEDGEQVRVFKSNGAKVA